ncbi:uncharacterized protein CIMG_04570 [Coccidioides immitis RS]|uniref:Fork-head domain-containing protein n=3 Tax=Coccidioides immitis TaxID=5501 RepID=A0A0E1S3C8_COCIM|nr:uncharacterized protein CIMG_04570 [Coccidioides immitis RS]EAS33546.2 hypothetical protein CIMG_04570 [Coccidioides immitis RS]KMU77486.1 forkhead protein [Coccidioides immitis RMSCC 3703]KMU89047.1 forkhead protein [Coccidioides immitis H538.4]
MEEVPMSHSVHSAQAHTTCTPLNITRLNEKLSLQQPSFSLEPVSSPAGPIDEFSLSHFAINMLSSRDLSENYSSHSVQDSLSDPYTWEFDMNELSGDSGLFYHQAPDVLENIPSSPSRFGHAEYEHESWIDINRSFPTPENIDHLATFQDFQTAHEHQELNSPVSVPDKEIAPSYDLQSCIGSCPSFEGSTSRPGSAVYSYFTTDNSMASSPLGDLLPLLQPRSVPDIGIGLSEEDSDTDGIPSDEPYAILIWKALMSAPGHGMVLKEIYEWFEKHTNKAKDPDSKGWQNSIRHNLSMNAAFEAVREISSPGGSPKKSGNVWVLTERAIKHGVQSTTRYRKPGIHKKTTKSEQPAPQRQRSGAKGGRAAKKAAKFRRALQEAQRAGENHSSSRHMQSDNAEGIAAYTTHGEQEQPISPANLEMNLTLGGYNFSDLSGCTDLPPESPIFYHNIRTGGGGLIPDCSTLDSETIGLDFNSFM